MILGFRAEMLFQGDRAIYQHGGRPRRQKRVPPFSRIPGYDLAQIDAGGLNASGFGSATDAIDNPCVSAGRK